METVDIDTEELDQPITVCTHKNCVEHKTLNDGGVVETIYSQECHTPCYLDGVEVRNEERNNVQILSRQVSVPIRRFKIVKCLWIRSSAANVGILGRFTCTCDTDSSRTSFEFATFQTLGQFYSDRRSNYRKRSSR